MCTDESLRLNLVRIKNLIDVVTHDNITKLSTIQVTPQLYNFIEIEYVRLEELFLLYTMDDLTARGYALFMLHKIRDYAYLRIDILRMYELLKIH